MTITIALVLIACACIPLIAALPLLRDILKDRDFHDF